MVNGIYFQQLMLELQDIYMGGIISHASHHTQKLNHDHRPKTKSYFFKQILDGTKWRIFLIQVHIKFLTENSEKLKYF